MTDQNKTSGKEKETPASPPESESQTQNAIQEPSNEQNTGPKPAPSENINIETKKAQKKKEKKGGKGSLALSLIAISLAISSSIAMYYGANKQLIKYNHELAKLTSTISTLESSQAKNSEDFQAKIQRSEQNNHVLIEQQNNSIKSLQAALHQRQGRRPNDWRIAEADYLVNLAGRQLWVMRDILTATTLMETADQRLANLNDPSLSPIRQAIAEDIQQLKSIKRVDLDGIVLRLNSLQKEIDNLPLANAFLPEALEEKPNIVSQDVIDWQSNLKASFNDFISQFITYRKREGSVVPLLTPAQTFYLKENLTAKLNQSITAAYRENTALYQSSLETAKEWTLRFFDQNAQSTIGFLQALNSLEQQTIEVTYPAAFISQERISDLLATRLQRDLAQQPTEEPLQ